MPEQLFRSQQIGADLIDGLEVPLVGRLDPQDQLVDFGDVFGRHDSVVEVRLSQTVATRRDAGHFANRRHIETMHIVFVGARRRRARLIRRLWLHAREREGEDGLDNGHWRSGFLDQQVSVAVWRPQFLRLYINFLEPSGTFLRYA